MALDVGLLTSEIRKITDPSYAQFAGYPVSRADAVARWTNAYDIYASAARDYSSDLVATKSPSAYAAQLTTYWLTAWTAFEAAQAFDNAFVAYWTGATFAIGILPPPAGPCPNIGGTTIFSLELTSAVTAVAANVLRDLLYPILYNRWTYDAATRAAEIAAAQHQVTLNQITNRIDGLDTTPPPVGPLPIHNICTVF